MKWTIVYSASLMSEEKEGYAHGGIDAEVYFCKKIASCLEEYEICDDTVGGEHEILVGETDRALTKELIKRMNYNQYGILRRGDKIAVTGHCVASTLMAVELLCKLEIFNISGDFELIKTNDVWNISYPAFSAEKLSASDCAFDGFEVIYSCSSADPVNEYTELLGSHGFELRYRREKDANIFVQLKKDDLLLHLTYFNERKTLCVFSGSAKYRLPEEIELSETVCGAELTSMTLDYFGGSFGMCYIITLEDGSYVIIDGGKVRMSCGYPKTFDYVRLYSLLCEMNKRDDKKIVIRAWLMTHEHPDHYEVFEMFCRNYGNAAVIERYICAPCSDAVAFNSKNPGYFWSNGKLLRACEAADIKNISVLHTGDEIKLGAVQFDVLFTVDDFCPERMRYFNESSFVSKMTYKGQSTMWLGDICETISSFIRKNYSESTIKSQIVQMAHHGLNGAEPELYSLIGAEVLLWSLKRSLIDALVDGDGDELHRKLAKKLLKTGEKRLISHTRDNYTLELPYIKDESKITKR